VLAFAKTQLTPYLARRRDVVKGTPKLSRRPTPPAVASAPGQGAESVNVDEPWRKDPAGPPPASRTYMQVPTPESITLANGCTVMLAPRRGLPVVCRQPRDQDRQRQQSRRRAGPARTSPRPC
jgi:hypothetical protein